MASFKGPFLNESAYWFGAEVRDRHFSLTDPLAFTDYTCCGTKEELGDEMRINQPLWLYAQSANTEVLLCHTIGLLSAKSGTRYRSDPLSGAKEKGADA
jgi:hypothetical protein